MPSERTGSLLAVKSRLRHWLDMGRPLFPERFYRVNGEFGGELNWLGRASNAWHHHTRFVHPSWLRDAFAKPEPRCESYWRVVRCRFRGHPNGYVYFNAGGMEPDYSCKDCGEIIA